jgi:hypothetical protein
MLDRPREMPSEQSDDPAWRKSSHRNYEEVAGTGDRDAVERLNAQFSLSVVGPSLTERLHLSWTDMPEEHDLAPRGISDVRATVGQMVPRSFFISVPTQESGSKHSLMNLMIDFHCS